MRKIYKSALVIAAMALATAASAQGLTTLNSKINVTFNGTVYNINLPANAISKVTVFNKTQNVTKEFKSTKAGGDFKVEGFTPAVGDEIVITLKNGKGEVVGKQEYKYTSVQSLFDLGVKIVAVNGSISVIGEGVSDVTVYTYGGQAVKADAITTSGLYIVKAIVNGVATEDKIFVDAK